MLLKICNDSKFGRKANTARKIDMHGMHLCVLYSISVIISLLAFAAKISLCKLKLRNYAVQANQLEKQNMPLTGTLCSEGSMWWSLTLRLQLA